MQKLPYLLDAFTTCFTILLDSVLDILEMLPCFLRTSNCSSTYFLAASLMWPLFCVCDICLFPPSFQTLVDYVVSECFFVSSRRCTIFFLVPSKIIIFVKNWQQGIGNIIRQWLTTLRDCVFSIRVRFFCDDHPLRFVMSVFKELVEILSLKLLFLGLTVTHFNLLRGKKETPRVRRGPSIQCSDRKNRSLQRSIFHFGTASSERRTMHTAGKPK